VLATALPETSIDLIESARRKAAVIERLAAAAGLPNARVVAARAEDWARRAGGYDAVTARALGPLAVVLEYSAPLLSEGGVAVAWKGARNPTEEAGAASAAQVLSMSLLEVVPVRPFAGSRMRHLHVFEKIGQTPSRFPRRPGVAVRRPLA
jgi:16S rRNA (guanine527-N7)-methyltransferase